MAIETRSLHAVHAINKYVWANISPSILGTIPFQGINITPLVPIEETPDLLAAIEAQAGVGTLPFIVYNWTKVDTGQFWMVETNEIAYSIRSADATKMRQLINAFDDMFKDYDDAAQRVNAHLMATLPPTSALRKYHFFSINLSTLGGQMPVDTEGGYQESLISIRVLFQGPDRPLPAGQTE